MAFAPSPRVRVENDVPVRPGGRFVLYWVIASRRTSHSFALDHAIAHARDLARPLVILEALRCDYPHASDRLHRFILRGMADNRAKTAKAPVLYHPYVERRFGEGKGLLAALAKDACVVITDRFPTFFLPHMVAAAARKIDARLEAVDGCGLLPLAAAPKVFARAHDFRRFLDKRLVEHLGDRPGAAPLSRLRLPVLKQLDESVTRRWPAAAEDLLLGEGIDELPIDHSVPPAPLEGGAAAGARRLRAFGKRDLGGYLDAQRHPDKGETSRLSPYLHFGHVGAHQILAELERVAERRVDGGPASWSELGEPTATFLDQLVTWRELGYVHAARRDDVARFSGLPGWCKQTLRHHAKDERRRSYELVDLEQAATADEVWNAAQRQLLREGRIHSYLRMIWGKRVIEWSRDPEEAFERLVLLNDKWALDGRDPNSYNGIGWCFGRYDRPWPTRPIYGQVRFMSSEQTPKKLRMRAYLALFGAGE